MSIKPVQSVAFQKDMQKTFAKIFTEPYNENPTNPFVLDIKGRDALYLKNAELDSEIYEALKKVALPDDKEFYLLLLDTFVGDIHWVISFDDENNLQFINNHFSPDYAIYSPKRIWGLLFYDDGHVIIGGTEKFIKSLFEYLPSKRKDEDLDIYLKAAKDFCDNWYNRDYSYISEYLVHMYSEEKAASLIEKYSFVKDSPINS
jgi:hypothetical protein